MKLCADAMRCLLPLLVVLIVGCKLGLPECDMAHSADTVYQNELGALCFECLDLALIGRKVVLGCEIALCLGNGVGTQLIEERLLHAVLERGRVGVGQRVAVGIRPLVHIEGIYMIARDLPLVNEVGCPTVHTHGTYGKDHGKLSALFFGLLDLKGDLMAHQNIKLVNVLAFNGVEVLVPEALTGNALLAARVDTRHIPANRIKSVKQGVLYCAHKIHNSFLLYLLVYFLRQKPFCISL